MVAMQKSSSAPSLPPITPNPRSQLQFKGGARRQPVRHYSFLYRSSNLLYTGFHEHEQLGVPRKRVPPRLKPLGMKRPDASPHRVSEMDWSRATAFTAGLSAPPTALGSAYGSKDLEAFFQQKMALSCVAEGIEAAADHFAREVEPRLGSALPRQVVRDAFTDAARAWNFSALSSAASSKGFDQGVFRDAAAHAAATVAAALEELERTLGGDVAVEGSYGVEEMGVVPPAEVSGTAEVLVAGEDSAVGGQDGEGETEQGEVHGEDGAVDGVPVQEADLIDEESPGEAAEDPPAQDPPDAAPE